MATVDEEGLKDAEVIRNNRELAKEFGLTQ